MDICVISERPITKSEVVLNARVIGGLRMIDNDEADDEAQHYDHDRLHGGGQALQRRGIRLRGATCPAERGMHAFLIIMSAVLAVLFLVYTMAGPMLPDVIAHKGPVWKMHGVASVDGAVAASADVTATIPETLAGAVKAGGGR